MLKELQTCKNCENKFEVTFKFCPFCGQQAKEDLTVSLLFYNTISNYFSFDARFLKSFLPLMLKPGFLAKCFVAGKRLLYLHPAQLYLFVSVIFFFVFSFIQREQVQLLDENLAKTLKKDVVVDTIAPLHVKDSLRIVRIKKKGLSDSLGRFKLRKSLEKNKLLHGFSESEIDSLVNSKDYEKNGMVNFNFNESSMDSLIKTSAPDAVILKEMGLKDDAGVLKRRLYKQALKFYKSRKGGSILQAFYDTIPIAMFFLLPVFALFLKLFYRKSGSYAHHLVFSFYYFSFLFTVFSIIISINFIYDIPDWVDLLIGLSTFVYLIKALRVFYQEGSFRTFFKGSVVTFLFLSFVAPLTAFILGIFAFMFY